MSDTDKLKATAAAIIAHHTAGIKPRRVVEAGVQANYLAIAPG